MIRRPPRSTRTDTLCPYTTLFRSDQPVTLAAFRGKPLIVNLWATWCAPCLTEMPSLDRLAGQLGGKAQLIVLSVDLEGRKAVTPYFQKMEFRHLQPYLDKDNVRSEERRVGKEGVSTGRSRWLRYH